MGERMKLIENKEIPLGSAGGSQRAKAARDGPSFLSSGCLIFPEQPRFPYTVFALTAEPPRSRGAAGFSERMFITDADFLRMQPHWENESGSFAQVTRAFIPLSPGSSHERQCQLGGERPGATARQAGAVLRSPGWRPARAPSRGLD
ncbi:hypothetical protein HPB50_019588 [Hyalomma asiaticum]|uniref:Uncharacterized protein n=1 Tax=Hyalomma asiaticum TaxID=266040 RepID=A0ACB7TQ75_HYAAI|nr:hypothetical protein HPB50_019588 [Hyalomma asiaticum]